MRVISLFDGIACGRLALDRAGIQVDSYDAWEIELNAIKAATANYPDIVEHGDVTKQDFTEYNSKVDLLIGGSPCQGFSFSGKMLNFNDSRSKLFFEYVRAINECHPKYFLLENVVMKQEWQDIISSYLGVEPIEINSALISAQNRRRLYWTNIPNVQQPKDKSIKLVDILDNKSMLNPAAIRGRSIAGYDKKTVQCLEVRDKYVDKSNCLTTVDKDNVLTSLSSGRYPDVFNRKLPFRYYTTKEMCRLQTLPDDYLNMIPDSAARKALGNGWTVDVIAHIFSYLPDEYKIGGEKE